MEIAWGVQEEPFDGGRAERNLGKEPSAALTWPVYVWPMKVGSEKGRKGMKNPFGGFLTFLKVAFL